ncbi:ShKT domain-containing protein [Caenorhabditis elegans]|uniref:ShKT domain-containing protein n=1 Tax=Caenorhabditis elegans TaxID=6239 RepID=Q9XV90_CAEEL|nr:ShKT domain-containing protein [Caenorhabditis elegans]CAB04129.1 ShKT domain-containing protein [Caenorhabditis elegans]|eukprot:NP_507558.1 Uncharacterized protein CELE_F16H6.3 [Caenorhabditis elegans]
MNFLTNFLISTLILWNVVECQPAIGGELNCTRYDSVLGDYVYTPQAVACDNVRTETFCRVLLGVVPTAGGNGLRPVRCWTRGPAPYLTEPINPDLVVDGMATCPKTCGFCCKTSAYNCRNADFPRLNCATILPAQCRDQRWRTIIAEDCPSACGFCNLGGCVDAIADCPVDISICNAVGMQDFVNKNCQRTCSRCTNATTTTQASCSSSGGSTSTCTSYNPDSSSSCAAWAANGFCININYTQAQKKSYCARTCKIC